MVGLSWSVDMVVYTSLFWSCGCSNDKPQVLSVREVTGLYPLPTPSSFGSIGSGIATIGMMLVLSVVDTRLVSSA